MLSTKSNEKIYILKFCHSSGYFDKLLETTDLTHFFIEEFSVVTLTEFAGLFLD